MARWCWSVEARRYRPHDSRQMQERPLDAMLYALRWEAKTSRPRALLRGPKRTDSGNPLCTMLARFADVIR